MGSHVCHDCGMRINSGTLLSVAGGRYFHENCFKCCSCRTSLRHCGYYFKDCNYYCKSDYQKKYCDRCHACGDWLISCSVSIVGDHSYHKDCLKCGLCHRIIHSSPVVKSVLAGRDVLLCSSCATKTAPATTAIEPPVFEGYYYRASPLPPTPTSPVDDFRFQTLPTSSLALDTANRVQTEEGAVGGTERNVGRRSGNEGTAGDCVHFFCGCF